MNDTAVLLSLVAAAATIIPSSAAVAQTGRPFRLCVVDEAALLRRSKVAIDIAGRFQQIRRDAQASYDRDRRAFAADEAAFTRLRPGMEATAVMRRDQELRDRRQQLDRRGEKINADLAELDKQLSRNAASTNVPVIKRVADRLGCAAVIARENLLVVNDGVTDITEPVLTEL